MRDAFDVRLTAAIRDVPVPDELAKRLLGRLSAERSRRRWLLAGVSLLAAAATVAVAVWLGAPRDGRFSEQVAIDQAIRAFGLPADSHSHLLSKTVPPEAYPISSMVTCPRGTRWRPLDNFLGRKGLIYDLPGAVRASLYVVESGSEAFATMPSLRPFTTAGRCASAWQEGTLLYVLVVQGEAADYEGYLNLPRSPVA
ncbi:MAG: hypothetical protein ABFC96_02210 [Thermoguttaceae bacterium]